MADTVNATGLRVQQWDKDFFTEYVQANRFAKYMGTNENSIIQLKEDLSKKKGDRITYALANRLTGAGITGTNTLEGNEESLDTRSHRLTVDKIRNAVRIGEMDEQRSAIDLRNAAKATLKTWMMEKTRDGILDALASINTGSAPVLYADASEGQKDTWLVDNADRVLFGNAVGVGGYTDHSADLTAITPSMELSTDIISIAKRRALTASPKIHPITTNGDQQNYVMFVHPLAMRDLKEDSVFLQANREARARNTSNPLFSDDSYIWDGVIIREVADIQVLENVGSSGTTEVVPCYLVGAQALGIAWAKRSTSVTKSFDYGDKEGCAIEEIRGIEKLHFGSGSGDTSDVKQHGVHTCYVSAVADA